jgi:heme exporter protein C
MIPWFWALTAVFGLAGLYIGFFVAPTDAQQGEGYRIIFVHVPASWMSMFIYLVMAFWAALGLGFNTRVSGMMAQALAPTGALMAFLSLWTGALWGKPMWGTWWVWDARLTSELILFFLYLGFIALQSAIDDPRRADKAGAVLALVGVVNIPIIYFSVKWWNTLHQGASVSLTKAPSMAQTMLWGMLLMALAFWMYSIAVSLTACGPSSSSANAHRLGGACSGMNWGSARILRHGRLRLLRLGLSAPACADGRGTILARHRRSEALKN